MKRYQRWKLVRHDRTEKFVKGFQPKRHKRHKRLVASVAPPPPDAEVVPLIRFSVDGVKKRLADEQADIARSRVVRPRDHELGDPW